MSLDQFNEGLRRMGEGIRRTHAAFVDADEGFVQALEGLKAITESRASLDTRMSEMQETIARLEVMLLAQGSEIRALREQLDSRNGGA
jgi:hypothetical protein